MIPGSPYTSQFTTSNPTTGAAQDADSLPVATASRNGVVDDGFVLLVTDIGTGRYVVSGTVPSSYKAGDSVAILVHAVVDGIAADDVLERFAVEASAAKGRCQSADTANAALLQAISGPQHIQTDAGSVGQYGAADLIKAANYLAATCAAGSSHRGLRFNRLIPDGTVQDSGRHWRRWH